MVLKTLLNEIEYDVIQGSIEVQVKDLFYDSRKVIQNSVFVCISGTQTDGHKYISKALEQGAIVLIVEKEIIVPENITVLKVSSTRKALSYLSAAYFNYPARELITIGLTGTKGKTTTSYMCQAILEKAGKKVGVIGTIGAVINGEKIKTANTTPESYELQKLFRQMVDAGCKYCIMEVSSQGLKMDRVAGVQFDYGVFTNFSADHIGPNEHKNMEEYLYCKSLLFKQCDIGLINKDDDYAKGVVKGHTCEIQTFGFNQDTDFWADKVEYLSKTGYLGIAFEVHGKMKGKIETAIPGKFSVYNSLAAIAICKNLGIKEENIIESLSNIKVPGRVEILTVSENFILMIDYAHNAASVENLLTTIKEYKPKRIVCVYGCGGNRSPLRRYDMGEICGKMADLSILTCDNPRDEEIESINRDIKVGLARSNGKYIEILDRTEAIYYSMNNAQKGDIIVLLGKGHEDYQEIKGKKYYYCERKIVEEYIEIKKKK